MNIFAFCAIAADDNCHAAIGYIDPFIQDAPGDKFCVLAAAKTVQDGATFLGGCFIGIM